ncbi:dicarboxylate/amino acid:cation symporter [Denitrobacterium detoxificans]|uniref:L-cystine uptake protein TcyP n=1 Tax=Denitrobacterium detoxificans TaxID=79604 RepID=A0A1H8TKG8_9ACTN|nr:cation:dicarboxylase symporter family transporter [Denitrobacterium detoxificans]SEO91321.1 Na+/H+-dicarboxylate symporter [Denitrobacterium detoxificans]
MAKTETVQVTADENGLSQASDFAERSLTGRRISACSKHEWMALFRALLLHAASHVDDSEAPLEISSIVSLGGTDITIKFAGKRFLLPDENASADSQAKIIDAFSDKFSCSYENGENVITISVGRSFWSIILPNLIAVIAAVIVGIVLEFTVDEAELRTMASEWVSPLEKLFTNAVLMIGAPVTLFSLLKNVTDSFIVAERNSSSRRLFINAISSSVSVVALALIMGFVFAQWALSSSGITERVDIGFANWSLASAVDQIIPSSIIEPFETISPIPMIFVALLIVGALNSIGKDFDLLKRAIDACYNLFSGILNILMKAFPVACFLLFLEVLLAKDGISHFLEILFIGIIAFASTIPLLALYALRLKLRGIRIREFIRKTWPLVKENYVIGSVIDAVPYNMRYCSEKLGISRERLGKELPILAQTSLDGNCFILMLLASIYIFIANCEVSWFNIAVIAAIVMFLSFGAPNQPGSILIGMLVILTYLNSDIAIALAICFELFCGGLQNILNVISSITTVAENERAEEKRRG